MDTQHPAVAPGGLPLITFTRSWDARTFVVRAPLSASERARFQRVLDCLAVLGVVALGRADTQRLDAPSLDGALDHLRIALGELTVDAAVAAAEWPASPFVPPQAVVPLWEFEQVGATADVLVADGLLLGLHLMVEAIRVEDAEEPVPVASCRNRWERSFAGERDLATVDLPGGTGPYVVRAVLRTS